MKNVQTKVGITTGFHFFLVLRDLHFQKVSQTMFRAIVCLLFTFCNAHCSYHSQYLMTITPLTLNQITIFWEYSSKATEHRKNSSVLMRIKNGWKNSLIFLVTAILMQIYSSLGGKGFLLYKKRNFFPAFHYGNFTRAQNIVHKLGDS